MDMTELMAQLRLVVEEAADGKCNMTAEGEECPKHGLDECSGYMEEQTTEINEAYINNVDDVINILGNLRSIGKKIELGQGEHEDNLANRYVNDIWDVYSWLENKVDKNDPGFKSAMDPVINLRGKAKGLEREPGSGKNRHLGNEIVNTLYPLMQWIEANLKNKVNEEAKPDFLDVDGDGDKKEPMKKALRDKEEEEKVDESIHIEVDGHEAELFINRMAELAGSPAHVGSDVHADACSGCGCEMDQCTCDANECCDDCGEYDCQCGDDDLHAEVPMENAVHDYGHETHDAEGETVDVDTYMYKAPTGKQRFVRSIGDNSLDNTMVKEDANKLFAKLKGDYKAYIAEAELARSNTGTDSPLTATDRDEFDKDPFAGDEPVTDGSRSPLSTIKRQRTVK